MTRLVEKVERNCIRGRDTEGCDRLKITRNLNAVYFTSLTRSSRLLYLWHTLETPIRHECSMATRLLQSCTFVCIISTIGDYLANVPHYPFVHPKWVTGPLALSGLILVPHKASKPRKGSPLPELTCLFHPRLPLRHHVDDRPISLFS